MVWLGGVTQLASAQENTIPPSGKSWSVALAFPIARYGHRLRILVAPATTRYALASVIRSARTSSVRRYVNILWQRDKPSRLIDLQPA
ncbi:MAG: hypothetical protein ACOX4G_06990 [Limnochordia bacterium]